MLAKERMLLRENKASKVNYLPQNTIVDSTLDQLSVNEKSEITELLDNLKSSKNENVSDTKSDIISKNNKRALFLARGRRY